MESYPDPAIVGKAFVKQYYTQMHRDPSQMHRFYLDQSSFVHGGSEMGSEEPVIGQKAIHDKILSLELHQVHAKIKQVDSHATLGNGIVIQVTGELSTSGHPMRAFVQTFVLAPESPKKYYVHNDIFRYQDDDLVSESETNDGPGEGENPAVLEQSPDDGDYPPAHADEAPPTSTKEGEVGYVATTTAELGGAVEGGLPEEAGDVAGGWHNVQYGDSAVLSVGDLAHNGIPAEAGDTPPQLPPSTQDFPPEPPPSHEVEVGEEGGDTNGMTTLESGETEPSKGTWASRLARGTGFSSSAVVSAPKPPPVQTQGQPRPPNTTSLSSQALPQRESRDSRVRRTEASRNAPKDSKKVSTLNPRDAPDTYQIFVGGLPSNSTEQDLRSVFADFGSIIEVRVNPKNFAFVVFDNAESVRKVITQKEQISLRSKYLNIEPKRPSAPRSGLPNRGKAGMGPTPGKPRMGKPPKR